MVMGATSRRMTRRTAGRRRSHEGDREAFGGPRGFGIVCERSDGNDWGAGGPPIGAQYTEPTPGDENWTAPEPCSLAFICGGVVVPARPTIPAWTRRGNTDDHPFRAGAASTGGRAVGVAGSIAAGGALCIPAGIPGHIVAGASGIPIAGGAPGITATVTATVGATAVRAGVHRLQGRPYDFDIILNNYSMLDHNL